ncbi:MAG: hypothetical protein JWP86_2194 [Phenylobacterium sp.]|nr:hypothetical protein [Phenylobacterium sp.]
MKKLLLSIAAVAALGAAAAPAAAQPWRGGHDDYQRHETYAPSRLTTPYVDGLEWKINNAAQEGRISWGEARGLRQELRQVQPIAWRVQTGQAGGWEAQRLERTVARIESAVNRGPRYGRYDRGDQYGRYDQRSDRHDGWR